MERVLRKVALLIAIMLPILAASPASAHILKVYAEVSGDMIVGEGYFSSGSVPSQQPVEVFELALLDIDAFEPTAHGFGRKHQPVRVLAGTTAAHGLSRDDAGDSVCAVVAVARCLRHGAEHDRGAMPIGQAQDALDMIAGTGAAFGHQPLVVITGGVAKT